MATLLRQANPKPHPSPLAPRPSPLAPRPLTLPLTPTPTPHHQVATLLRQLFHDCRLVHADFSEYNLLWYVP